MAVKYNNLLGEKFGSLTVIEKTNLRASNGAIKWKCRCDCGRETIAIGADLVRGNRNSCGCRGLDLTGQEFGEFTVVEFMGRDGHRKLWKCRCSCGNEKILPTYKITKEKVKSCGCQRGTHKMSRTRFYGIWNAMKQRCSNPNNCEYMNYGGRGITYDPKWEDFLGFYDDMYTSYCVHSEMYGETRTSIDRIDPNKNYCKDNCTWATPLEQSNNQRRNLLLTIDNQTKTFADWCRYYNKPYGVTLKKYHQGYPIEDIFGIRDLDEIIKEREAKKPYDIKNSRLHKMVELIKADLDSKGCI